MKNFLLTHKLYAPDTEGAGGGQPAVTDELPEGLRDKYIPKAVHEGTKGQLQQQANKYKADWEKATGELDVFRSQAAELTRQLEALKSLPGELETLKKQLGDVTSERDTHAGKNARMRELMAYPQLLNEATVAFVENSTLAPDALKANLEVLASAFKGAQGSGVAPVPAKQGPAATTPDALLADAERLRREGDMKGFRAGMNAYYEALDAAKGKFVPPLKDEKVGELPTLK
jgi:soluble cytochrome b562